MVIEALAPAMLAALRVKAFRVLLVRASGRRSPGRTKSISINRNLFKRAICPAINFPTFFIVAMINTALKIYRDHFSRLQDYWKMPFL
jgi:hypothetical protein